MMLWCFILALHLVLVNTLVITLPDVVVLKSTTTINFVTGSSDPSQWILRNVYANGTTQIGGTLSGTSSTTFAFQVTGPHFFQALALTNGTAASQPFYTGDVFTPVDLSATSSTSQSPLTATTTQTVVSSSCPSLESAENATTETTNSTGTIVGSVIGGLGFSAALAFFLLWFNLRRQYKRLSRSAPSTLQIHNAPSTTPLMAPSNTYYAVQTTPHQSHSSSSDLAHPMVNPPTPLTPQRRSTKLAVVNPDNSTTHGSHRTPSLDMSEALISNSSYQGGRNVQSQTGGVLRREVSLLRRELEEIRQAHSYDVPPPTY